MTTVTISIPDTIAQHVDDEVKKRGFATRSEFIRSLLRQYFSPSSLKSFTPIALSEVEQKLTKTGKYNKRFVTSVVRGLSKSSVYED